MEAVIFIGIQATGKSTFYDQRFAGTHVHINLDTVKTRHRESVLLQNCIREGRSFVVDNTNVLASERARYIEPAKAAGYTVMGYFFQSRLADALQRNRQRTGKAVIPDIGLISKHKILQLPSYEEGFDQLYYVFIVNDQQFSVRPWVENEPRYK